MYTLPFSFEKYKNNLPSSIKFEYLDGIISIIKKKEFKYKLMLNSAMVIYHINCPATRYIVLSTPQTPVSHLMDHFLIN